MLFGCLTALLLVACEPLAPEQTPQVIVVTGQTPNTPLALPTDLAAAVDMTQGGAVATAPSGVIPSVENTPIGVVNTPVPSPTPTFTPSPVPTATPYVCAEKTGQLVQSSFFSAIMGEEVSYRMYLPPCFYDTLQRYPSVTLLHGTGYDDAMWDDLGVAALMDQGISQGTLPPMVLVMPDGGYLSELNDQPEDASYETVILDELLPMLETDFCLWGSRGGRAIGGISRGGFWAFSIALRHPEVFSALGGHSPHFDADNTLPEYNPLDLATVVSLAKTPLRIYIDNSRDDYVSANALLMSNTLSERGIEHEHIVYPTGEHNMDYWRQHVGEYLAFYGRVWPRDINQLPSCLEPSPE